MNIYKFIKNIHDERIKSFCLKEACKVFKAQTCYEEHATLTPLELAKKFYSWITSSETGKQQE